MSIERAANASRLTRALGGVGALAWLGLGLGIGWMAGLLADHLGVPADHLRSVVGLVGCAAVLVGWVVGTRLVYLDVVAGVRDARNIGESGPRSRHRWVVAIAGPVIGIILALTQSHATTRTGTAAHASRSTAVALAPSLPDLAKTAPLALGSTTYIVQRGDSLSALATRFYGSPGDWIRLARANARVLGTTEPSLLIDPTVLPAGLVLRIPGPDTPPTPIGPPGAAGANRRRSVARDDVVPAVFAGFGILGATILAESLRRRRRLQSMRLAPGSRRPRLDAEDAHAEAALRPLVAVELVLWIDAANRLLFEGLRDRRIAVPPIGLIRAGRDGVDVLLEEVAPTAPDGFVALDGGRTWRLEHRHGLDALVARLPTDARPLLPVLLAVGEDAEASYLVACAPGESLAIESDEVTRRRALGAIAGQLVDAAWSEVAAYRLGPSHFLGAADLPEVEAPALRDLEAGGGTDPLWRDGVPESQPVVLVEQRAFGRLAVAAKLTTVSLIGDVPDATRRILLVDGRARVEPLGLEIPARLPSADALERAGRIRAAAEAVPDVPHQPELWSAEPAIASDVPPSGAAEVRILRSTPDIVGDTRTPTQNPDAVAFVAYLALHGSVAETGAVGAALTFFPSTPERRAKSVARAASGARRTLGPSLLPVIGPGEPHRLAPQVSCDWLRFCDMVSLARACARGGDGRRAEDVYRAALELVGDGPLCSDDTVSSRYLWLDAEQLRDDIESRIVASAYELAMLCIDSPSSPSAHATARWAIDVGRRIDPDAKSLRDAALFLADSCSDVAALDAEFNAALDAVDALALGADVDAGSEAIYSALKTARRTSQSLRD